MIAFRYLNVRGSVANKTAIDFDISAWRGGIDLEFGCGWAGVLIMIADTYILIRCR